jgi:integrase
MPRPRRDGTEAAPSNRRKLTEIFIRKLAPKASAFAVWDSHQRGLALLVQVSGHKSWKCVYSLRGRARWYHIGAADAVGLSDARKLAGKIMVAVADGHDPVADRKAERGRGTFEQLAKLYVEQHAKRNNKSWKQADFLVRRHLLPRWAKLQAADIKRSDVKAMMMAIGAPILANQVLASASAIFSWAIRQELIDKNPCILVERNKTTSRERVLSDSEIPVFWAAFDNVGLVKSTALKLILLTGQRPGEVSHMRREHIEGAWWTLPGDPVPALDWPGTKNGNSNRVWLSAPALALLAELEEEPTGFVFATTRRSAVSRLDDAMQAICAKLGAERLTPHDLRRTNGTTITALGFGRDAMNRIQNHREGGIASVYDRHQYAEENKRVMEAVAARITALVDGTTDDNVVRLAR